MAAQQKSRTELIGKFVAGATPTGEDFANAWSTFISQKDDGLLYDGKNLVISSKTGITLGNPDGGFGGTPGTLRFNGTHVQYYDPGIHDFKDIAGDAGAFTPVTGQAVAFGGGKVGIGTFTSALPPTHLLEIPLKDNSGPEQEVLLGKLVVHNGPSTAPGAYIGHSELAANAAGYALFQDEIGKTKINASNVNQSQLSLAINNDDKLVIDKFGDITLQATSSVTVLSDLTLGALSKAQNFLIARGDAFKPGGGPFTDSTSDIRVKKNLRPFKEGLAKVLEFNPVVYNFNGKGGTLDNNKDYVGLIAQDVQKIMPALTISRSLKLNQDDSNETEILTHDLGQLTFMFINAIKELSARLEKLEKPKKNANRKTDHSAGADH